MRSTWHRANLSLATRCGVLLMLATTLMLPDETREDARESQEPAAGRSAADNSGITVATAVDTAWPGQRIGVVVHAGDAISSGTDAVLTMNGRAVTQRALPRSGTVDFEINVPPNGPLILGAEVRDRASDAVLTRVNDAALINVATPPAVVVVARTASAFAASLRDGNWPVRELRPADLTGRAGALSRASVLVLDDIAADDFDPETWSAIETYVRREAMGLLVLGGSHSFGLGGYRESILEGILPVISEPPASEPPASLMFLIDVSGSMDRVAGSSSRLQIANQAVVSTAKALRPIDRVGLMTFEVSPRQRLPLATRARHGAAIEQAWPGSASGGTRLVPAVLSAIEQLERDDTEQRILVLLTDGFVEEENLDQLARKLQVTTVDLIALIVADEDDRGPDALHQIVTAANGRAMRIADVLQLPTLMRNEIEKARPALVTSSSRPVVVSPTPWLPDVEWPSVEQHLLTRPRDAAEVHLVSASGDALIASMTAGAGRVVAVTTGFSSWTPEWLRFDRWPDFAADITAHLAGRDTGRFDISVDTVHSLLKVDRVDRQTRSAIAASLVNPSGEISAVELEPSGPGRLEAGLQLEQAGQYLAIVEDDDTRVRHRFLYHPATSGRSPEASVRRDNDRPARQHWLTALAALAFVALLWLERRRPVRAYVSRR